MSLFRKILAEYKEEEKRKYELANPCKHKDFEPYVWDGQTACFQCCKHEYKDFLETDDGETTCTLCWVCWPSGHEYCRTLKTKKRKKPTNPKIRLTDENGKNRRVKYCTIKNVQL